MEKQSEASAALGDVCTVSLTLPLGFRFSIQAHECHTQGIPAELCVAEPRVCRQLEEKCAEKAQPLRCHPSSLSQGWHDLVLRWSVCPAQWENVREVSSPYHSSTESLSGSGMTAE